MTFSLSSACCSNSLTTPARERWDLRARWSSLARVAVSICRVKTVLWCIIIFIQQKLFELIVKRFCTKCKWKFGVDNPRGRYLARAVIVLCFGAPFYRRGDVFTGLRLPKICVVCFNLQADALFRAWNRELHYTPAPSGSVSHPTLVRKAGFAYMSQGPLQLFF